MSDYPDYSSDISFFRDTIKDLQAQIAELSRDRNVALLAGYPTGSYLWVAGRDAPAGTLLTDGGLSLAATYPDLNDYLRPVIGNVTVTVANPAVFTLTNHRLVPGDRVFFRTGGALPTGLNTYQIYYVIASGLTASTFQVSASLGGAAIVTSGTQSGTHTVTFSPYETGTASPTSFRRPDNGDYVLSGYKAGSPQWGSVGTVYGEKTHTMTQSELVAHTHIQDAHSHGVGIEYNVSISGASSPRLASNPAYANAYTNAVAATNQNTGSSQAFNVIQPTRAALLVIKT